VGGDPVGGIGLIPASVVVSAELLPFRDPLSYGHSSGSLLHSLRSVRGRILPRDQVPALHAPELGTSRRLRPGLRSRGTQVER
jgi:hypothetical protein